MVLLLHANLLFLPLLQGTLLPAGCQDLVFCQNKGGRTATTEITQPAYSNSSPR